MEKIKDVNVDFSDDYGDGVHDDDNDCNNTTIILAIDVGSSSIRTTAYHYFSTTTNDDNELVDVVAIPSCSSSIPRATIEPTTCIIQMNGLLDAVDHTIDEVLSKLRSRFDNEFHVEAVGFSTFVMNLVAVNDDGGLVTFNKDFSGGGDNDDKNITKKDVKKNTNAMTNHAQSGSISYACNAPEVNRECQRLRQELGPNELDRLYQATGAPLHSAYALPQLRVLYKYNKINTKSNSNDNNSNNDGGCVHTSKNHGYRWQSIAGYFLSQWNGRRRHLPITYSEASWTGLLNARDCVYEESALQLLPTECRETLPELADFSEYVHGILQHTNVNTSNNVNNEDDGISSINPYWTRFVELRQTKFFLGIADGACANIGSKCTTSLRIAVTIGTSAAARICIQHDATNIQPSPAKKAMSDDSALLDASSLADLSFFQIPECRGLFCYRIDRRHVLVGGALTDGGSVVEWATRLLNLGKDEVSFQKCLDDVRDLITAEYQQQQRDEDTCQNQRNLLMVPFLSGERSTGFRDGATGAVFGLTRETTPAIFFKSCLEGVSLRLKAILDLLLLVIDKTAIDDHKNPIIVASGQAMEKNEIWRQMIADCSGLRVVLDKDSTEGTSRGVARLVAISLVAENATAAKCTGGCNDGLSTNVNKNQLENPSLVLAQHKEVMHPFITSEPRPTITALYSKKALSQEDLIDSISPLFCSS